jgi:hypothetical protein
MCATHSDSSPSMRYPLFIAHAAPKLRKHLWNALGLTVSYLSVYSVSFVNINIAPMRRAVS